MTEHLQAELLEAKAEVHRLRELCHWVSQPFTKTSPWYHCCQNGQVRSRQFLWRIFFASIEGSAGIGRWEGPDRIEIAILKLAGLARTFYQGYPDLHDKRLTWQKFKEAFRKRYKTFTRTIFFL